MTTSRPVRLVAVAAIAGCAALSLSGVSAASTHHSTKKAPKPKTGLYAVAESRITSSTTPAAYAVDSSNYEHFVQFKAGSSASTGKIVYRSRKLGAKKWITHNAPGTFNTSGQPRLQILSDAQDSNGLDIVAYTCSGVYAVALAHTTTRLAEFTKVTSTSDCAKAAAPQQLAASFYNADLGSGYLNVIVPDGTTAGQYDVMSGKPGSSFTNIATVPSTDSFVPTQFVGQSFDGGVVVGRGVDSDGHLGVFATTLDFAYDSTSETDVATWTDLKEVATLASTTKDYTISSAAFLNDNAYIGLYLPAGTRSGQKHTLFGNTRDSSGQWSSPISIDGTNLHDKNLVLNANKITGKLRVAWQRVITSSAKAKKTKSGIMTSRLLSSGWTTATFETHWYRDQPLSISYDSKTLPHFFYKETA